MLRRVLEDKLGPEEKREIITVEDRIQILAVLGERGEGFGGQIRELHEVKTGALTSSCSQERWLRERSESSFRYATGNGSKLKESRNGCLAWMDIILSSTDHSVLACIKYVGQVSIYLDLSPLYIDNTIT